MSDFDYSDCLIDPENESQIKRIKETYSEFNLEHPLLTKDNGIIKYIVATYDINSPLRELYPNFFERKARAAVVAGFKQGKNKLFPKEVEDVMIGRDDKVNAMIVRYIIMHGSPDITAYVAYNEIMHSELRKSLAADGYESRDLKATRDNISYIVTQLNSLHQKVFGGTEGKKLKDELYKTLENDRIKLRPEDIAIDLANKEYEPGVDPWEIGEPVYVNK